MDHVTLDGVREVLAGFEKTIYWSFKAHDLYLATNASFCQHRLVAIMRSVELLPTKVGVEVLCMDQFSRALAPCSSVLADYQASYPRKSRGGSTAKTGVVWSLLGDKEN